MFKKPLISIIIPIYNTESYLRECLDSVIGNSYDNLQIICVDDGSTDGSLNILNEYKQNDPRILVINKSNGGVSSARNVGLLKASGDYVSFIDSDDIILFNYYERLINIMIKNDADIIDCQKAAAIRDDGKYKYNVFDSYGIVKNKSMRSYIAGKIYKKSIIDGCFFRENIPLYEDRAFNLDVVRKRLSEKKNLKGIMVYESMYRYTDRSESAMHSVSYEKAIISINCLRDIALHEGRTDIASIYGTECIRQCLILWYQMYLFGKTKERKLIYKEMVFLAKRIRNSRAYSLKELIPFKIFSFCPRLYRLFRIVDDPTMRQYEKSLRDKLKRKDKLV